MSREAIFHELASRLMKVKGIMTFSRTLRHWNDVDDREMPALFLAKTNEIPTRRKGLPTIWTYRADLWLYVNKRGKKSEPPSKELNEILDRIALVFEPSPGEVQILGLPYVSHVWIDGTIETDEGNLGDLAVALIPIEILASP